MVAGRACSSGCARRHVGFRQDSRRPATGRARASRGGRAHRPGRRQGGFKVAAAAPGRESLLQDKDGSGARGHDPTPRHVRRAAAHPARPASRPACRHAVHAGGWPCGRARYAAARRAGRDRLLLSGAVASAGARGAGAEADGNG
eukprot:3439789-Prymnesium_polylepis.1